MTGFQGNVGLHPKVREFTFALLNIQASLCLEQMYCDRYKVIWDETVRTKYYGIFILFITILYYLFFSLFNSFLSLIYCNNIGNMIPLLDQITQDIPISELHNFMLGIIPSQSIQFLNNYLYYNHTSPPPIQFFL